MYMLLSKLAQSMEDAMQEFLNAIAILGLLVFAGLVFLGFSLLGGPKRERAREHVNPNWPPKKGDRITIAPGRPDEEDVEVIWAKDPMDDGNCYIKAHRSNGEIAVHEIRPDFSVAYWYFDW